MNDVASAMDQKRPGPFDETVKAGPERDFAGAIEHKLNTLDKQIYTANERVGDLVGAISPVLNQGSATAAPRLSEARSQEQGQIAERLDDLIERLASLIDNMEYTIRRVEL